MPSPASRPRRLATYSLFAVVGFLLAIAAAASPLGKRPVHTRPTPPSPPAPLVQVTPPPAPVVQVAPQPPAPETPQVEVVFALDTTSSMTGLIDGAKREIWSLVNFISSGQPQPHVRIGLVAFRDKGDAYVTRFYDLSDDVDQVFHHLMSFAAEGGGDTPEHVAKALSDAVERPSWSKGDKVARIIYVVGDAPPHTDYDDGYDVDALARVAARKGIHVNTIRCGDDAETATAFKRIARLGGGQFASVDQSGGVATLETPFDKKLAELNKKLLDTTVAYGRGGLAMKARAAEASALAAPVAADRVAFAVKNHMAVSGEGDLIGHLGSLGKGAGGVNSMSRDELPADLRDLAPAEREKRVADKMEARKQVMAEIADLSARRDAALKTAERTARKDGAAHGFDDHVRDSIKAATAGVVAY